MGQTDNEVEDRMEALAALDLGGEGEQSPSLHAAEEVCPTCGRPTDEAEGMSEGQLLDALQVDLLRDLYRGFRQGTITHQEKAILRGMLRDNKRVVTPDVDKRAAEPLEQDEALPPVSSRRTELPTQHDFDQTDGG